MVGFSRVAAGRKLNGNVGSQSFDFDRCDQLRRDGWTAERQLRFLDALASTRNIAKAAAFVGMSRESAYRLRGRRDGLLFGALWDRILSPKARPSEVHMESMTGGQIARLLGNHFRRERGDFVALGARIAKRRHG